MYNFKNIFYITLFLNTISITTFAMQGSSLETLCDELKKKPFVVFWHYDIPAAKGISVYFPKGPQGEVIRTIHLAAINGDVKVAEEIIQKDPTSINVAYNYPGYPHRGKTSLHLATEFGHVEMVKFLLQNGAMATINTPVNNTEFECHNMNALDIALRERIFFEKDFARAPQLCPQYDQIIKILLSAGAQPSERHPAQS